jgi:hypothetical protein
MEVEELKCAGSGNVINKLLGGYPVLAITLWSGYAHSEGTLQVEIAANHGLSTENSHFIHSPPAESFTSNVSLSLIPLPRNFCYFCLHLPERISPESLGTSFTHVSKHYLDT